MTATNGLLTQPLFPYTIELLRPCWLRLADRPLPIEALAELLRAATWRARPLLGSAVAWHPTEADADAFARLRERDPSAEPLHWPSATWTEDAPPTLVLTPTELACFVYLHGSAWRVADTAPLQAMLATIDAMLERLASHGAVEQRVFPREPWRPLDKAAWWTTRRFSTSEPAWTGWLGLVLTPIDAPFDMTAIRDRLRRYWGHVEREDWHYLTDGTRTPDELRGHQPDGYLASAPAIVLDAASVQLTKSHGDRPLENGNRHDFLRWLTTTWPCRGQCCDYGTWWPRGITADHLVAPPIEFDPAWLTELPIDPHGPAPSPVPSIDSLADASPLDPALIRWLIHGATWADGELSVPDRIAALYPDDSDRARLLTSLALLDAGPIRPRALDLGLLDALPERLRAHTQLVTLRVQARALDPSWRAWLTELPALGDLYLSDLDEVPPELASLPACVHADG